jgi:hypothetical protein
MLKTTSECSGCGRPLGDVDFWHCQRCHTRIWRGAFRHRCVGNLIAEHAHDVDLWRTVNPDTPCPCHEWGVGPLLWGTHGFQHPSGLILPS